MDNKNKPKSAISSYEAFVDSMTTEFYHEETNQIINKLQECLKEDWPEFKIGKQIAPRNQVDDWQMFYALIRVLVAKGILRLEDLK